jgi:hypothetical protein
LNFDIALSGAFLYTFLSVIMGIFSDDERGSLEFEEDSETSSNVDEREEQLGPVGQVAPTAGIAFDHIDTSAVTARKYILSLSFSISHSVNHRSCSTRFC